MPKHKKFIWVQDPIKFVSKSLCSNCSGLRRILCLSRKLKDISSLSRLTWTMPATELPKTLVNLLGTLLTENGLLSWQIFEEKSSNIVVKIRFGNGHCDLAADRQPSEAFTAYRRKAPSQVKRDHARVAAHKRQQSTAARMTTRSMVTCLQTEPCATDQDVPADEIEQTRYGDNCLDPQAIYVNPYVNPRAIPTMIVCCTKRMIVYLCLLICCLSPVYPVLILLQHAVIRNALPCWLHNLHYYRLTATPN